MRPVWKSVVLAGIALAGTWGADRIGLVAAQEENKPARSARGGLLVKTDRHQFEVFFYPTGVRVFPQDKAGEAVDASRLSGSATFFHPNSPKPWFSRPLRGTPASLDLTIGLGNAPQSGAKVAFEITGISGNADHKAAFTVPLEFVPPSAAQPTQPQGGVPTIPRYLYGPGSQGYGYYEYTGPGTYSTPSGPRSYMSSIPGMYGPGGMTVGPGHRDWSTGRDLPLAKPWLKALD